jgi:hypothetical protein
VLLREGAAKGMWPKSFAEQHTFSSDPVIVDPDVTEVRFLPEDEFLVLATDGLWDAVPVAEAVAHARKLFGLGRDAQVGGRRAGWGLRTGRAAALQGAGVAAGG